MTKDDILEGFPLADAVDCLILMHRDAHFGGSFDVMASYYENEGKGICPDFDLEHIMRLADMEGEMKQNLAPIALSGAEAEKVAQAKNAYKKLRELYSHPTKKNRHARLLADLILSEEEVPEKEIEAIVSENGAIVPALIQLLKAEDYYDPLFPGYGHAPALAAQCLGRIGDRRSIISLFESIGDSDFFDEEICFQALKSIGAPAKEFLLKVLHGRPINTDNERAAIALIYFKDDPEVAKACLEMLKDPEVRKNITFATYLALACEQISDNAEREAFIALADDPQTPKMLREDMKAIYKGW